jgi:hypothetical protein
LYKRTYRVGRRKQRLAEKGNKFFSNPAENSLAEEIHQKGIEFSKRGYPDFTVYNSDGSIFGFIEVKPRKDKELRINQQKFADLCQLHDIPFLKWAPEDGEEPIKKFLETIS